MNDTKASNNAIAFGIPDFDELGLGMIEMELDMPFEEVVSRIRNTAGGFEAMNEVIAEIEAEEMAKRRAALDDLLEHYDEYHNNGTIYNGRN